MKGSTPRRIAATLMAAFEALHVAIRQETLEPPRSPGPAYVIAGGENGWPVDPRGPSLAAGRTVHIDRRTLTLVGAEGGSVVEVFEGTAVPIEQAGGDPTFGAVAKQADSVELKLRMESPGSREDRPVPPSLGFGFDLFFGSHEGDVVADAVARVDADGPPPGRFPVVPPIAVTDDGNLVIARLDAFGSTLGASAPLSPARTGCATLGRTPSGSDGGGDSCEVSTMSTGGRNGYAPCYGTLPDAAATAIGRPRTDLTRDPVWAVRGLDSPGRPGVATS